MCALRGKTRVGWMRGAKSIEIMINEEEKDVIIRQFW